MESIAALEFSHLFELNDADAGLDVYQDQFGRPDIPDPAHPFEKFFNGTGLRKEVGDVNDCAWNTSLESPLDEALEKACASAQSAIEQFVISNKHLLHSERLNCTELLKSFREERECQR
jgi:hypothetical protein